MAAGGDADLAERQDDGLEICVCQLLTAPHTTRTPPQKNPQGTARDAERRERERAQLADLVGRNLTLLSQLEGLGFEAYAGSALPRLLEQIVACRDGLAQRYLMQALIAVRVFGSGVL